LVGDVGFDPCFLSSKADTMVPYFTGILQGQGPKDGLSWYREAELMHGRICMVAVLGFIAPGFGTIPGNEWTDSFGYTNPLEAFSGAPTASLFQIFTFMSVLEFRRISFIIEDGANYVPGSAQKWGQGGSDYWNPLGLNYSPAEYAEKQLQEIKHGRLAMIGFLGLVFQAQASGVSVVDQLSSAFVEPGYVAKAGYFLPEGI
jgi:Chlorophyll A-B binding protein